MTSILRRALEQNQLVRIMYMDNKGQITDRIVRILDIQKQQFSAHCFYRKQKRLFKLNNVLSMLPVHEKEAV